MIDNNNNKSSQINSESPTIKNVQKSLDDNFAKMNVKMDKISDKVDEIVQNTKENCTFGLTSTSRSTQCNGDKIERAFGTNLIDLRKQLVTDPKLKSKQICTSCYNILDGLKRKTTDKDKPPTQEDHEKFKKVFKNYLKYSGYTLIVDETQTAATL